MDRRRSGGGVQIGSSYGIEPGDVGGAVLRASKDCCSSEVDSGKIVLVGVGERGISRSVVKGGKYGILNLPSSWNNRCS
jgi:hypothetical protein